MFRPYVLIGALLLTGSSYAQPPDTERDNPNAYTRDTYRRTEGGYGYGNWGLLGLFGLTGLFGLRRRETTIRGRRDYRAEQLGMPS